MKGQAEREKANAAREALRLVHQGNVVGLGSGSTAALFIRQLGAAVSHGLKIKGVPTSENAAALARRHRIPLVPFEEIDEIDITIDGADEIDPNLNLIKGGGGALLREKIVAAASSEVVIIASSEKHVSLLGKFPLPVEVVPFARKWVSRQISSLGARVTVRATEGKMPFVTDSGHNILDCRFRSISDPDGLGAGLKTIPGIVEHGLFIRVATRVLTGIGDTVVEKYPTPMK